VSQELSEFLQQVFNALRISGIYALVAIGITIIFGLTGIVKFSIGELITLGAFLTFAFWDNERASFFLAVPLAAVAVGALSLGLERGLFRFTLSEPINGFMVSLGLILVLQNVIIEFWGTDAQAVQPPFTGIWDVGGVRMPAQSWFVITVAFALIAVLYVALHYTKQGRALRACAEDREAAALMGIPVNWYIAAAFALGGAMAATAGGLLASLQPITNYLGASFLLKGFAVALVGGLGSIEGAVAAALLIGFTETMAAGYGDDLHLLGQEWQNAYTFGLMILILLWRPTGLFRGRGRLQETLQ
jgi:branched-chain amino acid transport system permease protein